MTCPHCCEKEPCAAKISVFRHLDRESLEEISTIAVHKAVKKGEILFTPDNSRGLYLISEGKIKVYELTSSGREFLLQVLHEGDFVGEEALFGAGEAYTYGEALSDGRVCYIDRADFLNLLSKHPSISLKLLEEFSRRLRESAHRTASSTAPVLSRLCEYFVNLSKAQESDTVTIPLQIKELASLIGTTPETLSRRLGELEKKGIIRKNRREINILDKQKLEKYL